MTTDYLHELQKSISSTLKHDAALASMVAGIYINIPHNAAFPYIALDTSHTVSQDTSAINGMKVKISISIFSKHRDNKETSRIIAAISGRLGGTVLTPNGCLVTAIRQEVSGIRRMEDGITWHGHIDFSVTLWQGGEFTPYDGRQVAIKIGNGAAPLEEFMQVAGLRNASVSLANRIYDSSGPASGVWRAVNAMGISALTVSGDGFFAASQAEETMLACAFSGSINNYEITLRNNKISGPFVISEYKRNSNMDAPAEFRVTLESAGEVVITMTPGA